MLLIDLPIDQSVIHPSLPLSLPPSIHPSTVSTAYPLRQVQPWIESTSPARHLEFLRRSTSWHVSHKCNIFSRQPLMNSIIFKTQISIRLPVCCFVPAKTLSFGWHLHIDSLQTSNYHHWPWCISGRLFQIVCSWLITCMNSSQTHHTKVYRPLCTIFGCLLPFWSVTVLVIVLTPL